MIDITKSPPIVNNREVFFANNINGGLEITFKAKNKILNNNIKEVELKIFNLNNQEISFEFVETILDLNNDEISISIELLEENPLLLFNSFYKFSIRLKDSNGQSSPWSNIGLFKIMKTPEITKENWEDKEISTNNNNLFDRITIKHKELLCDPPEKIEYYYYYKNEEKEGFLSPLIIDNLNYDDNEFNFNLQPFLSYPEFRNILSNNSNINIQLYVKYVVADGYYQETLDSQTLNISVLGDSITINSYKNNNILVYDGNNDYIIFNNDLNLNILSNKIDYTTQFKNIYSFFKYFKDENNNFYLYKQEQVIYNDFIDTLLIDVKRKKQLNITLNNKISSFKRNLLETKTDTLSGVYPRFYRNQNTKYKELPISGTISYQSLLTFENEFEGLDKYNIEDGNYRRQDNIHPIRQTNLTNLEGQNIYSERLFREDVLDFLQNTDKFLFKSPTEGNIVVKLMNISLTPNQQLGRMIYDFSCTAYEVQNLQDYLDEIIEEEDL